MGLVVISRPCEIGYVVGSDVDEKGHHCHGYYDRLDMDDFCGDRSHHRGGIWSGYCLSVEGFVSVLGGKMGLIHLMVL
jgi:hypothetical protein